MEMSLSNPLMISFFVVFFSLFILTLFIAKKSDTRKLSRILFTKKNINRDLINLVVNGIKIQPPDKELSFEKMSANERDFTPYYKKYILPLAEKFEENRINALKLVRKRLIKTLPVLVVFAILLAVFLLVNLVELDAFYSFFFLMFFGITIYFLYFLCVLWACFPIVEYGSDIKKIVFSKVFQFFGNEYQYSEESSMTAKSLKRSAIIPASNDSYFEDYIKGSYKGINLELSEAHLIAGRGKEREVVFAGLFILLSMNKRFSGRTIVKENIGRLLNKFEKLLLKAAGNKELKKVNLEDPLFQKKYAVYSSDQIEARYLLTTSFMQRLIDLEKLFSVKKSSLWQKIKSSKRYNEIVQCSFYDDQLLLMISSDKNRFETDFFQPATFVEDINNILKEMALIFQIIDALKLGQKTGL